MASASCWSERPGAGVSLGLHESQSRLWENLVGRSRAAWTCFLPELKQAFPGQLRDVDVDRFYRAINKVQPGLIRVDADELTYSLHVVLRFELEQEMLTGTLNLDELPDVWNARMKSYLGVDVPDAARGVLQDVHWSLGLIGYFPTYVIGSIVSAQIWAKLLAAIPDLQEQIERGVRQPARLAARPPAPAWSQVHAEGDAAESSGDRHGGRWAVRRIPPPQIR
jgi:carboxypeptidase Taq